MFWYIYPYSLFYWKRTFSPPEFSVLRHKVCVSMWKRFRFYDIKFSFLRGNVSVATTQRLRFYDIKFPILYRNVFFFWHTLDTMFLQKQHLTYWLSTNRHFDACIFTKPMYSFLKIKKRPSIFLQLHVPFSSHFSGLYFYSFRIYSTNLFLKGPWE